MKIKIKKKKEIHQRLGVATLFISAKIACPTVVLFSPAPFSPLLSKNYCYLTVYFMMRVHTTVQAIDGQIMLDAFNGPIPSPPPMTIFPSRPLRQNSINQVIKKHPSLFGIPFILLMVAASYGLTPFTQTRYDLQDQKVKHVSNQTIYPLPIGLFCCGY